MLKVKTSVLQKLLNKALRGATNNPAYLLTSLMEIYAHDGILQLSTTSGKQFLTVKDEIDVQDEFRVIIPIETFSKLVMKTTSDDISLDVNETALHVSGNGEYDIELMGGEISDISSYPIPELEGEELFVKDINTQLIRDIIMSNKDALSTTLNFPALVGYYIDENGVITSDSIVIAKNEVDVVPEAILVSPELMQLMTICDDDIIHMSVYDNYQIHISTSNVDIVGVLMDEIEDFPLAQINGLDTSFEFNCVVSRINLLNILDRLSLFIDTYDENGVYLHFQESKLQITSKQNNASESLAYTKTNNDGKTFTCLINIMILKNQLNAYNSDVITIEYGKDESIRLSNGKLSHQISTLME